MNISTASQRFFSGGRFFSSFLGSAHYLAEKILTFPGFGYIADEKSGKAPLRLSVKG